MKDEIFNELLESVKQGASIIKGTMQHSRSFEFPETEVRALREQFGLSQESRVMPRYALFRNCSNGLP